MTDIADKQVIMAKFSPAIFLKSESTRRYFVKKLRSNVACALKRNGIDFALVRSTRDRIIIRSEFPEKCIEVLKKVFGLHSVTIANYATFSKIDDIVSMSRGLFSSKKGSFAIECSRVGKHSFTSRDVEVLVGAEIVKAYGLKVNLSNPDNILHIDIENNNLLFYFDEHKCFGGLPQGVEGNVAVLFEGPKNKIDSLICAWLMMRKGCNVFPVKCNKSGNFDDALKILSEWNLWRDFRVTDFSDIASLIGKEGISAIVSPDREITNESLLVYAAFDAKFKIPVFRPLLLMPKAEISNLGEIVKGKAASIDPSAYI
ncbi:MAG: THUMP domain-containing protein [Candidatus Diapherotrites archaeon]